MKLTMTRPGFSFVCGLALILGPLTTGGQAGLIPWVYNSIFGTGGHGHSYGGYYGPPGGHYAGYGGYGGGCCLSSLFHGHTSYVGYAPTYSAPRYYAPPAGNCCQSPAYSYGVSDLCCSNDVSFSGGNCATGECVGADCGVTTTPPYSAQPVPDDRSTPANPSTPSTYSTPPNRTFPEEEPGGFSKPQMTPDAAPSGGGIFPNSGADSNETTPGGFDSVRPNPVNPITPSGGTPPIPESEPSEDGLQFNFKVPGELPPTGDDGKRIAPLKVESQVATLHKPHRQRAHYRAIFQTPSVIRTEVPARPGWEPLSVDPKLIAHR